MTASALDTIKIISDAVIYGMSTQFIACILQDMFHQIPSLVSLSYLFKSDVRMHISTRLKRM